MVKKGGSSTTKIRKLFATFGGLMIFGIDLIFNVANRILCPNIQVQFTNMLIKV